MTDDARLVHQVALAAIELAESAGADAGATSDLRRMLVRVGNLSEPTRVDPETAKPRRCCNERHAGP